MKKKEKIGLVLAGGGGKGAYQIGVLKALEEYKLHKNISCISGTSIGSLNAVMYLSKGVENSIAIWSNLSNDIALTRKNLKDIFFDKSFYSREGVINLAKREVDFEKIQNSPVEVYVIATPMGKKNVDAQTTFKLNDLSEEEILNVLLASSALPYIFEPVIINGIRYKDGYVIDNVPVKTLKDVGCTTIFVIPLRASSPAEEYADENTTIIDFLSEYNDYGFFEGTLDFNPERAMMRVEHGYNTAKQLIQKLIKEGVIAVNWRQKIRKKWKNFINRKKPVSNNYHVLTKEEILVPPTNLPEIKVNPELNRLYNMFKKRDKKI